jgi:hypothetical protein
MSKIDITGAECEIIMVALNYYLGRADLSSNGQWLKEVKALNMKICFHYEDSLD